MNIVVHILQSILALMFLMAGTGKMFGSKMHVEGFKHWQLPQWFRVVTGVVEFAAAVALIIGYWEPSWLAAGALLLGITAIGGSITHIRVKDTFKQTMPIVLLGVLAFALFFLTMSDLADFPGFQ